MLEDDVLVLDMPEGEAGLPTAELRPSNPPIMIQVLQQMAVSTLSRRLKRILMVATI